MEPESTHNEIHIPLIGDRMKDSVLGPITTFVILWHRSDIVKIFYAPSIEAKVEAVSSINFLNSIWPIVIGFMFAYSWPLAREAFLGARNRAHKWVKSWADDQGLTALQEKEICRFFTYWMSYNFEHTFSGRVPGPTASEKEELYQNAIKAFGKASTLNVKDMRELIRLAQTDDTKTFMRKATQLTQDSRILIGFPTVLSNWKMRGKADPRVDITKV